MSEHERETKGKLQNRGRLEGGPARAGVVVPPIGIRERVVASSSPLSASFSDAYRGVVLDSLRFTKGRLIFRFSVDVSSVQILERKREARESVRA